jgi:hypothetical protein
MNQSLMLWMMNATNYNTIHGYQVSYRAQDHKINLRFTSSEKSTWSTLMSYI